MVFIGRLDANTRVCAYAQGFVVQKKKKDKDDNPVWVSKWYYTKISDVIRGYAKHVARTRKGKIEQKKDLVDLIDLVGSLERTITEVGDRLSKEWVQLSDDIVENSAKQPDTGDDHE